MDKNHDIIHFRIMPIWYDEDGAGWYNVLCCDYSLDPFRSSRNRSEVTCKNCLEILRTGRIPYRRNRRIRNGNNNKS